MARTFVDWSRVLVTVTPCWLFMGKEEQQSPVVSVSVEPAPAATHTKVCRANEKEKKIRGTRTAASD